MTNWFFMFWGKARAIAVLMLLPMAMYAFGGFAPMLDMELDHNKINEIWDEVKKDNKRNSQDPNDYRDSSSDSGSSNIGGAVDVDNSGNPN